MQLVIIKEITIIRNTFNKSSNGLYLIFGKAIIKLNKKNTPEIKGAENNKNIPKLKLISPIFKMLEEII
tara:strand:- start:399 stop:605 length:207 start_codon:yes stop_codon:yes gene_type:complete